MEPAGLAGAGRYCGATDFLEGGGSGVDVVALGRPYLLCSAENAAAKSFCGGGRLFLSSFLGSKEDDVVLVDSRDVVEVIGSDVSIFHQGCQKREGEGVVL